MQNDCRFAGAVPADDILSLKPLLKCQAYLLPVAAEAARLALPVALSSEGWEESFSLEVVAGSPVPMAAQTKRSGLSDTPAVVSVTSSASRQGFVSVSPRVVSP
jgi:hypothetical protein